VRLLAAASVIFAALALAAGYAANADRVGSALGVALGLLWLAGLWRGWGWVASPALACLAGLAALGALQGLSAAWMLAGAVAALAAWDLDRFARRLRAAGHVVGAADMARAHLRRLLLVAGLGLSIGGAALAVQVRLSFGWALLGGAIAILSLSRVFGFLRRAGA
jgi:hypothetical protein